MIAAVSLLLSAAIAGELPPNTATSSKGMVASVHPLATDAGVAALQKGARHFVQKPVKAEILYEVIKYVMGDDAAVATPTVQES